MVQLCTPAGRGEKYVAHLTWRARQGQCRGIFEPVSDSLPCSDGLLPIPPDESYSGLLVPTSQGGMWVLSSQAADVTPGLSLCQHFLTTEQLYWCPGTMHCCPAVCCRAGTLPLRAGCWVMVSSCSMSELWGVCWASCQSAPVRL